LDNECHEKGDKEEGYYNVERGFAVLDKKLPNCAYNKWAISVLTFADNESVHSFRQNNSTIVLHLRKKKSGYRIPSIFCPFPSMLLKQEIELSSDTLRL